MSLCSLYTASRVGLIRQCARFDYNEKDLENMIQDSSMPIVLL